MQPFDMVIDFCNKSKHKIWNNFLATILYLDMSLYGKAGTSKFLWSNQLIMNLDVWLRHVSQKPCMFPIIS